IDDYGLAGIAVQLVRNDTASVFIRCADVDQLNKEDLALVDGHIDFLAGLQAVKIRGRRQATDIAEFPLEFREVAKHLRIHEVRVEIVAVGLMLELRGQLRADFLQLHRRNLRALRLLRVAEHDLEQGTGPPAHRFAQSASEHVDHALREARAAGFEIYDIGGLNAAGKKEEPHVADDFRRRRDLHDVAEKLIHFRVAARDFRPAMTQPHRRGLLLEIRVLAARHLVEINLGAAGFRRSVEWRVERADVLPVVAEFIQRIEVETGVARGALERGDDRVQVRLRSAPAHARYREIN